MKRFSLSTDESFLIRTLSHGQCIEKSEGTDALTESTGKCTELFYVDSQNCLVHSQTRHRVSKDNSGGSNGLETNNKGCTTITHNIDGKLKAGDNCVIVDGGVLKEHTCSNRGRKEFVLERGNDNIGQSLSYIIRKLSLFAGS